MGPWHAIYSPLMPSFEVGQMLRKCWGGRNVENMLISQICLSWFIWLLPNHPFYSSTISSSLRRGDLPASCTCNLLRLRVYHTHLAINKECSYKMVSLHPVLQIALHCFKVQIHCLQGTRKQNTDRMDIHLKPFQQAIYSNGLKKPRQIHFKKYII